MTTIEEKQKAIIDEFALFDDWMDKYAYIIELGKDLEPLPEEMKTKENLIEGCQSKVWVLADYSDGKVHFRGDSDAILTKGLVSLIIRAYTDQTPSDIIENQPTFIEKIGLSEHLSPTRSNGLNSMIKQIKLYAMAYKVKYETNIPK
ncbi:MAG TPA: SufE family protein [Salinivirgaceae bacterium]|nr:SufE family protein [Salinivirgaceae bacterium]HQA76383.1 SufE family protein [Salinivirgaceae bacterium]